MLRLGLILYTIASVTLAGTGVVAVISLDLMAWRLILLAAALGAIVAVPVAYILAAVIIARS